MAEIDTTPLESVKAAVDLFDRGSDQRRRLSSPIPDWNEEEDRVDILTKELATCKLQLEVRASQHKQAAMQIEALQKAVQELSCQYERECMDAHLRIAQLEAENIGIMSRQSAADGELAAVKADLAAARALVLREVEAVEASAVLERESTRDALARILQLNETVLSSAVAAIRAEEERSVFFQEATLQFFDSDRNLELLRKQMEMMEGVEMELLAKTVEVEFLRAELMQLQLQANVSPPQRASSSDAATATTVVTTAAGCSSNLDDGRHDQVQVLGRREETVEGRTDEAEPEFTFQHSPGLSFVSDEIFRKDSHAVPSGDGSKAEVDISEGSLAENKQGAAVAVAVMMVEDTTVAEGDSDAQQTRCLVAADKVSGEDATQIQPRGKGIEADTDSNQDHSHVEAKADDFQSFVLEISRDDLQSVHTDAKDVVSIAEPGTGNVASAGAANQEARRAAEPEAGQGTNKQQPDGYVLVSKGCAGVAADDKRLDEARTEISDLRFSLEDAVRRAELAEEAKVALERELREEIRRKQRTPSRRRATSDSEEGRRPTTTPTPSTRAPMRSARPGGEDLPTPRCLTLGKVLNMKYK